MLLKCCILSVSKSGKLSSGHRPGKGQFSFQSQRRAMPKNVQSTVQVCSFHILMLKNPSSQASTVRELRTSRCTSWIQKRQRNQRTNCQHPLDNRKSKRIKKKKKPPSTSASLNTLKPLTVWITTHCGKFLKEWEYQTTFPTF